MFENYKIVVTGATSGIGLATTKKFLEDGATVIGLGRDFKRTEGLGEGFIPFRCDVTDMEQMRSAVDFIGERFDGVLDCFVNNAGGDIPGKMEPTPEEFEYGVNLLLRAPFFFGQMLHPMLSKSQTGNASIVNVASAAGHGHGPHIAVYALMKSALIKLTTIQTNAYKDVRCNTVCPGFVNTPIFERGGLAGGQIEAFLEARKQMIPAHRIAEADEVADLILFLASTDASFVYGAEVLIDGGFSTSVC